MSEVLLDLTREEWDLIAREFGHNARCSALFDDALSKRAFVVNSRIAAYAERKALTASARTNIGSELSDLGKENQAEI